MCNGIAAKSDLLKKKKKIELEVIRMTVPCLV